MPSLADYGQAAAATTLALRDLIAPGLQVTTMHPSASRAGVDGASVNVFLLRDDLAGFQEGGEPIGLSRLVAELHYLVSAYPADDADSDALSHQAFGAARAAIERNPVLSVTVRQSTARVQLRAMPLSPADLIALWTAIGAPLRLSFEVTASFTLDAAERLSVATTLYDVISLTPGSVAVFSGTDVVEKAAAVTSVANELSRPLISVGLSDVISDYLEETERNLARLFEEADRRGAVIFLDEADALFGAEPARSDLDRDWLLTQFARAPGLVIIAVERGGEDLTRHAAADVHFPPRDL
ncbi:AAA family ATPase [Diaminobutyricimonas sp. TR449]|uniref:AAA family ATPase n=1 Tax=Diaminobutyricimonas sp. TR449 TaxID=2708076 RepID=UPI001AB0555A|nr:AAA family ATPase [Diaminobutyricimonas sp. TR449]